VIGLNKSDILGADETEDKRAALEAVSGAQVLVLSGVTGTGVPEALRTLNRFIALLRAAEAPARSKAFAP
jgi:GTP-binding protein